LGQLYEKLAADLKVNNATPARVIFARDTRASGSSLVAALVDSLKASGAEYTDYKLLTTPQLHYLVRCENTKGTQYAYGDVSEVGYYEKLSAALKKAMQGKKFTGCITVDCANGVGGPKLRELIKYLPKPEEGGLEIRIINDDVLKPENLNMQVSF
jgi:phosphoacetylglucosamine mutase